MSRETWAPYEITVDWLDGRLAREAIVSGDRNDTAERADWNVGLRPDGTTFLYP